MLRNDLEEDRYLGATQVLPIKFSDEVDKGRSVQVHEQRIDEECVDEGLSRHHRIERPFEEPQSELNVAMYDSRKHVKRNQQEENR